jgi:RHS repeat-associated protein
MRVGVNVQQKPSKEISKVRFTGKERDSESGNDYFGARYYGSTMGRFLSPDYSDGPDPVPFGDLGNPQSFNLYRRVAHICKLPVGAPHLVFFEMWVSQDATLAA